MSTERTRAIHIPGWGKTPSFTRISCDAPDCPAALDGDTAVRVRRALREMGWDSRPGHDYCPEHREEA